MRRCSLHALGVGGAWQEVSKMANEGRSLLSLQSLQSSQGSAWRARAHERGRIPSTSIPFIPCFLFLASFLSLPSHHPLSFVPPLCIPATFLSWPFSLPFCVAPAPATVLSLSIDFVPPKPSAEISIGQKMSAVIEMSKNRLQTMEVLSDSQRSFYMRCVGAGWSRFDYLLIESSGIGEPLPVAQASHAPPPP